MIQFRLATLDDAPQIASIHRQARAKAMPWLPVLHTPDQDLRFFRNRVLPNSRVECAVKQDDVIGFSAMDKDWLDHLYIHPSFWRLGAGGALLNRAMTTASSLQLWAFQENHAARAFYKSFGFREVEITDGQNNEEQTPDVRLEWVKNPKTP